MYSISNLHLEIITIKKGLLLLSNKLDEYENIIKIIDTTSILIFSYDPSTDFTFELYNFLRINKIQFNSIDNVGWIFHSSTKYPFTNNMINNFIKNYDTYDEIEEYSYYDWNSIIFVINSIKPYMKYKRFDFIACSLGINPLFIHFKKILESETKLNFAYSDDDTGNGNNADWVLESHGINLIGMYFKLNSNEILAENSSSIIILKNGFFKKIGRKVVKTVNNIGDKVENFAENVGDKIVNTVNNIGDKFKDIKKKARNAFINLDIKDWDDIIKSRMNTIFDEIGENFLEDMDDAFDNVIDFNYKLSRNFDRFENRVNELGNQITNFVSINWKDFADNFQTVWKVFIENIKDIDWKQIKEITTTLATFVAAIDPTNCLSLILALVDLTECSISYDNSKILNNLISLLISIINVVLSIGAVGVAFFTLGGGSSLANNAKKAVLELLDRILLPLISAGCAIGPQINNFINDPSKTNRRILMETCASSGLNLTVSVATGKKTNANITF